MDASEVATEEHIRLSVVRPPLYNPICCFYHPQSCMPVVKIRGEVNHKRYIACVKWSIWLFLFWNSCVVSLIPSTYDCEIAASSQIETYSNPTSNSISFISIVGMDKKRKYFEDSLKFWFSWKKQWSHNVLCATLFSVLMLVLWHLRISYSI